MRPFAVITLILFCLAAYSQDAPEELTDDKKAINAVNASVNDFYILFSQDLDDSPLGPYSRDNFIADWKIDGLRSAERTTVLDYNTGGRTSRGMEWTFPEGTFSQNADYGYQWRTPTGGNFYECYLTYSIMFKPGFEPVLGGKLPCLLGYPYGHPLEYDYGFYAGIMFKEGPKPVFYVYHHDMSGRYGDTRFWNYTFDVSSDIWYDITLRVVMNTVTDTVGNHNGVLEGYVNGELVGQWAGLRLRNFSSIGVSTAVIQAFFGGATEAWETIRDEWMLIDNVCVWRYSDQYLESNPGVPRNNQIGSMGDILVTPLDVTGDFTDPGTGEDLVPPSRPVGLSASRVTHESVVLNWNTSSDNREVSGYNIYRDGSKVGSTPYTSFTLSGLQPTTLYGLSVASYDAAGNVSPKSSVLNVTTNILDLQPPTIPTQLNVVRVTGYSIELSWNPSQDNVGVDLYEIRMNGVVAAFVPGTSYIAGGLSPGNTYRIEIRALDRAGNASPFTAAVSVTTGDEDSQAPVKPTGLSTSNITSNSVNISWNPSVDNVAVKGYRIYVNNELRQLSSTTAETIVGLTEGLRYDIAVSAFDDAGNESQKSDVIQVTTKNGDITTSPTLPEVTILNVNNRSMNPESVTELKSLGFTELDAYGIIVTQNNQPVEEGFPIFALKSQSVVHEYSRIEDGLIALYDFSDNDGNVVSDISGSPEPTDLYIDMPLNTAWLPGPGLRITSSSSISTYGASINLIKRLRLSNEVTVEAWVKQEVIDQSGPARIVTLSKNTTDRGFTLGHSGNQVAFNYVSRLQTTNTDANGFPELKTNMNFTSRSLHHVVYTRDSEGTEILYVNGLEMNRSVRTGDFSSWSLDYHLVLGNEITGDRPWKGILYLVAIYDRALTEEEININYTAGFGRIKYTTDLSPLEPNKSYSISPFVKTDQGVVYGEKRDFMIENVLFSTEQDSIYMALYPNPSNGDFRVFIEYTNSTSEPAILKISDMSGQVIYSTELEQSQELVSFEENLVLTDQVLEGIYSVILIIGNQSVARRLIIHQ